MHFLRETLHWHVPSAFEYVSSRMILAALTTLLFTIFLGPRFIKKLYELKIGQSIRMEECPLLGQLHQKKSNTPTMGGILILAGMLLSLVLWMDMRSSFTAILAITTIALGFIGGIDDYLKLKYRNAKGLKARYKMLMQVVFAICIGGYLQLPGLAEKISEKPPQAKEFKTGETLSTDTYISQYYLPFYKKPIFTLESGWKWVGFFIMLLVIVGASNAVNLTDGLDGLAAGTILLVSLVFSLVAFLSNHAQIARYLHILYIEGSGEIAIYLAGLCGACLGFLWYNGYPAQVFMGDTGSIALGGILGVVSILLRKELLLALSGGIFVVEALSVILQVGSYRLRKGKRIFLVAPLHHHFEFKGWPETKVVLRFWIIGFILAMLGLASLKFQ